MALAKSQSPGSACDETEGLTPESEDEVNVLLNLGGNGPDAELSGRLYPA